MKLTLESAIERLVTRLAELEHEQIERNQDYVDWIDGKDRGRGMVWKFAEGDLAEIPGLRAAVDILTEVDPEVTTRLAAAARVRIDLDTEVSPANICGALAAAGWTYTGEGKTT